MVDSSSSTVYGLAIYDLVNRRWQISSLQALGAGPPRLMTTAVISPGHSSLAAKTLSTSTMSVSHGKNAINQHIALSIAPRTHQRRTTILGTQSPFDQFNHEKEVPQRLTTVSTPVSRS